MTGGTIGGYKKVLALFRKDAKERLPVFSAFPSETALAVFVTQAHAIKSAAGTIGAAEVSAGAAGLEAAGKAGDAAAIQKLLPGFTEKLAALAAAAPAVPEEVAAAGAAPDPALLPLLRELAEALRAKKMGALDRVLEELSRKSLDNKTREALDAVSDNVLMGEYDKALETVAGLPETIQQE
jgi:HPt (histidine-containing phosphotransfer) domain-containing protein